MKDIPEAIRRTLPASPSTRPSTSVADRQWVGLCVACCLALNWPLSTANLGAVKVSLLLTFALQSPAVSSGGPDPQQRDEWFTFAQKALAVLKRDSARMLVGTRLTWLNFLQSSLTRQIYANRRMLLRSQKRSLTGAR